MFDSDIPQAPHKEPLFYFKYPMKLEFLPFIEQEVQQFITFAANIIQSKQKINQILVILNKRIKDIDNFYREYWSDYRAHQILRAKKLLLNFCRQNHKKISERIVQNDDLKQIKNQKADIPKSIKKQIVQIKQNDFISIQDNQKDSKQKTQKINKEPNLAKKGTQAHSISANSLKNRDFQQKKNTPSKNKLIQSPKILNNMKESPTIISALKQSPRVAPKITKKEQPQKKITKEQYIAYLRSKNKAS